MAHLRSKLLATLLLLLTTVTAAVADPQLNDLSIHVELLDNGDARITEVRRMHIDGRGTECYIVMGHLNGSRVEDLTVSDETGLQYENIGEWDIDASRSRKAGRCGVVTKSNGYELCWGLGDEGERTYTVSYTVTKLVRAYDDADGFNFMFVAQGIKPAARHAQIVFTLKNREAIPQEQVKMWAFRYDGDIQWKNGTVVAETAGAMSSDEAMIVMLRLEKGLLHPAETVSGSFDQLKDKAFEGSDYGDDEMSWLDKLILVLVLLTFILFLPLLLVGSLIYKWYQRRKAMKDLLWYRDLPFGGSLQMSNQVVNAYRYFGKDYKNLISALTLRLISIGALRIEEHLVQPTGLKRLAGASAKPRPLLAVKDFPENGKLMDQSLLRQLHNIFRKASGDDLVLQPNELRNWLMKHSEELESFMTNVGRNRSLSSCSKDLEHVRQVFGMRLFLQDFTLANERHATEVSLWKEYLVFAELFGIAKQVRKDMQQANADYLKMDETLRALNNEEVLTPILLATTQNMSRISQAQRAERARGSGGSASFGGGGGFSGGGIGGGVR